MFANGLTILIITQLLCIIVNITGKDILMICYSSGYSENLNVILSKVK